MPRPPKVPPARRILWLSWKDSGHPAAGGAEEVLHQIVRRLAADGHDVTILTAAYDGAPDQTTVDGARVIRLKGNRYTHSFQALWFYRRHLYNQFDIIIEVVNTAPYFAARWPGRAKPVLLYHQLAREVWFHETGWPLNRLGYHVLEPLATKLLAASKATVLSMSPSTSRDLRQLGFATAPIQELTEGIHIAPAATWDAVRKYTQPTLLSLGAIRSMKNTLDQISAFELVKQRVPNLRLIIAGQAYGDYGQRVLDRITASRYRTDVTYLGKISAARKRALLGRCHLLVVTAVKEGWGLTVSEANSQGTPAVVYDADGLRDSVRDTVTGLVSDPNPAALANDITMLLQNPDQYRTMRRKAYAFSRTLTFDQTYADFSRAVLR